MLTEAQRSTWIAEHGPWLYWSLFKAWLWPWVMRDGIQPPAVTGESGLHPEMESRPGHIYFMTDCTPRARTAAGVGNEAQVRVDIRALDLNRFAADEDRVGAHSPRLHDAQGLPGWPDLPERSQDVPAGEWMNDQSRIVDQSEWV